VSRPTLVLGALLLSAAVLTHTRLYQPLAQRSHGLLKDFPTQLGEWRMTRELPPSAREVELLETENIVTRIYRDRAGREITAVLVYDPSGDRKMAHPQEICLTATGLQLIEQRPVELYGSDVTVQRLLMQRGDARSLYYYWYKAGNYQSGSYLGSQVRLALRALAGQEGGTALVRLSTPVSARLPDEADRLLQDFGRLMLPAAQQFLP